MLRKKTHTEATADGSIDKMELKEVKELVGFYAPIMEEGKEVWDVTMSGEGQGYFAKTQFEAQVVSSLEEVKVLLLKNTEK